MAVGLLDELAKPTHFLNGVVNELLTAEARVDGHKEHHVKVLDDFFKHADGGVGVEGDSCFHASVVYLLDGAVEVGTGFVVYVHHVSSKCLNLWDELVRVNYHQVNVEGFLANLGNGFEHGKAEADVGHEDAVHHVEVKPVGLTAVYHVYVLGQVGEIGSKEGWRYFGHGFVFEAIGVSDVSSFKCKTGLSYHLAVAEDEELVGASFEELGHVTVHGHTLFLACVVDIFLFCVVEGGVLVGESALCAHYGVIGLEDTGIKDALSVCGGHVLHDGEAEGETLHVLHTTGFLALLVFGGHPKARGIELGSDAYFVLQLVALGGERADLGVCLADLLLHVGILLTERLVEPSQRIDLHDVALQHLAEGRNFSFEPHNLAGIGGFCAFQLFEELLGMATFFFYLCDEAVVAELALEHLILHVEVFVLALHLLLFQFCQLFQLFVLLLKRTGVEVVVAHHGYNDSNGDYCDYCDADDEAGVAALFGLRRLCIVLFFH